MTRTLAILTLAAAAAFSSGCTRTSTYVPPGGFHDPEAAQCRGHSSKREYDACIIAGRTGRPFAEVWRELRGPEVTPPLEPSSPFAAMDAYTGVRRP